MTGPKRYSATATAIVALAIALAWALGGRVVGSVVLLSGVAALLVQVVLFVLLDAAHGDDTRFLRSWVLGMLVRFGCIGVAGLLALAGRVSEPTVLVLSTAAFLFALHLLETAFLGTGARSRYAR